MSDVSTKNFSTRFEIPPLMWAWEIWTENDSLRAIFQNIQRLTPDTAPKHKRLFTCTDNAIDI